MSGLPIAEHLQTICKTAFENSEESALAQVAPAATRGHLQACMLLEALHQPQLKAAAAYAIMRGISAGHLSGPEVRRIDRVTLDTPDLPVPRRQQTLPDQSSLISPHIVLLGG